MILSEIFLNKNYFLFLRAIRNFYLTRIKFKSLQINFIKTSTIGHEFNFVKYDNLEERFISKDILDCVETLSNNRWIPYNGLYYILATVYTYTYINVT
jgi:hypothetical protein